jgi:hypothetical protein
VGSIPNKIIGFFNYYGLVVGSASNKCEYQKFYRGKGRPEREI